MTHSKAVANKKFRIKSGFKHPQIETFAGNIIHVEDYWDIVSGKSWKSSQGNAACIIYSIRSAMNDLPIDDEVVYGKIGPYGHLVHINELEEI